jgi:hypothetical protein
MRKIQIRAGAVRAAAQLHDNETADAIWQALPIRGRANRWGDEVYFEIPVRVDQAVDACQVLEPGELGYWPVGHAFCIFWGPTPASRGGEIRAASAVNVFGQLEGDAHAFAGVADGEDIQIDKEESI